MFYIIATIVVSIISVILIVAIAVQDSKSYGLSSSISGGSGSVWTGTKSRSKEGKLVKITTIAGIAFLVVAILLNVGFFTGL